MGQSITRVGCSRGQEEQSTASENANARASGTRPARTLSPGRKKGFAGWFTFRIRARRVAVRSNLVLSPPTQSSPHVRALAVGERTRLRGIPFLASGRASMISAIVRRHASKVLHLASAKRRPTSGNDYHRREEPLLPELCVNQTFSVVFFFFFTSTTRGKRCCWILQLSLLSQIIVWKAPMRAERELNVREITEQPKLKFKTRRKIEITNGIGPFSGSSLFRFDDISAHSVKPFKRSVVLASKR